MKVKIAFTIDVDYEAWAKQKRELTPGQPESAYSKSACRDNLQAICEENFAVTMDDYVPYKWVG